MVQARLRSIFVPPLARSVFLQVELEDKTIDASGVVDGDPSAVLNLVWSLVLHFQASLSHHTSPQVVSVCQADLFRSDTGEAGGRRPSGAFLQPPSVLRRRPAKQRPTGYQGIKPSRGNPPRSAAAGPKMHVQVSLEQIRQG